MDHPESTSPPEKSAGVIKLGHRNSSFLGSLGESAVIERELVYGGR